NIGCNSAPRRSRDRLCNGLRDGSPSCRGGHGSETLRSAHQASTGNCACANSLTNALRIAPGSGRSFWLPQKRLIERHILHVGQEIAASDLLAYPVDCAIGKRYSPDDAPRHTTDELLANVCDCFSRGRLARESLCECLPDDISRRPVRELGNAAIRGFDFNGHYQASPVSMFMSWLRSGS